MKKILVVEDEIAISMVLKAYLQRAGYEVTQVYDGAEVMENFEDVKPDLVLLDVMLPGKDGWSILNEIREQSTCPIIMLTALTDIDYRLTGLKSGADDYIAKPFVADEVVARVQAVLRRSSGENDEHRRFGSLYVDFQAYKVELNGEEINLTPRDLSLFLFFC